MKDPNSGVLDRQLFDLAGQTEFADCHTSGQGLNQADLFVRNPQETVCLLQ